VFARKLLRIFGLVTKEDVQNEVRAIDIFRGHGISENIVSVIDHGWLSRSYYYIDMELCEGNLEQYIMKDPELTYELSAAENPRLLYAGFEGRGIWNTWDIMEQVASGIEFVHGCGEAHRDLKPRNS
jgi:serine/threonine protein kinase